MALPVKKVRDELKLENVRLIFKNFRGEKKQFNEDGKRNFAIQLDEVQAEKLRGIGWNVKDNSRKVESGEHDEMRWNLPVNVKMDSKNPPRIFMIAFGPNGEPRRTLLDEDTVGLLDFAKFANVDLIVRPYNYDYSGRQGVTAYLVTLYATLLQDDLEKKYAHIPLEEPQRRLELEEDDGVIDVEGGEWIDDMERLELPAGSRD